ncbi:MAG TPA: tetratricopeptide repeat protein [Nitrospinaceae bacterium]|nr:tetratricopeptide repeat protein [Nitrospinaceae bacterium]
MHIMNISFLIFFLSITLATPVKAGYKEIQPLVQQGAFEEALVLLESHSDDSLGDISYLLLKGSVLAKTNHVKEAISIFIYLIEKYPELPEPYINLATTYLANGDHDRAEKTVNQLINVHRDYALDKEIYTKMASQSYYYESETNKLSKNESIDRDIKTAINNWVKAWTDKNLTNYFKSYSATFSPQKQLTYSQWKKQRRALLNKPEFIKIHLDRVKIALLGKNRALVSFIQTYQSNYYNDEVNKKLLLNNTGEGWLISKEYSN